MGSAHSAACHSAHSVERDALQDASPVNDLQIDAAVVEREILRYTPAGIPILAVLLQHQSSVTEAGLARQVEMSLPAVVAGSLTDAVQRLALGEVVKMRGFLAPKRRNTRTLVFHITELQDIGKD